MVSPSGKAKSNNTSLDLGTVYTAEHPGFPRFLVYSTAVLTGEYDVGNRDPVVMSQPVQDRSIPSPRVKDSDAMLPSRGETIQCWDKVKTCLVYIAI